MSLRVDQKKALSMMFEPDDVPVYVLECCEKAQSLIYNLGGRALSSHDLALVAACARPKSGRKPKSLLDGIDDE